MNINDHIGEAPRAELEVPQLALPPEAGWSRRIRFAFYAAALAHVLLVTLLVRESARQGAAHQGVVLLQRPNPERVVYFQPLPERPPASPPLDTRMSAEGDHRAQSEVPPRERSPVRLPAADGSSAERQPEVRSAEQRSAPRPPEPAPGARRLPDPGPEVATRQRLPPILARRLEELRREPSPTASAAASGPAGDGGVRFDAGSLDQAIRQQGFANPTSGVSDTGSMDFDAKDFEWSSYARKVYVIVDGNWKSVIPLAARLPGVTGRVAVSFRIHRDGSVTDIELAESCGQNALDQAALASIQMSRLPPLPPEYPRDEVGVTFRYFYNLPLDP